MSIRSKLLLAAMPVVALSAYAADRMASSGGGSGKAGSSRAAFTSTGWFPGMTQASSGAQLAAAVNDDPCTNPADPALAKWQCNWSSTIDNKKPDIVLFIADDMAWWDAGAANWRGRPDLQGAALDTPNLAQPDLDFLAQYGTRFSNAYAASPVCTVSRSSFYTGLYPQRHGATENAKDDDNGAPVYNDIIAGTADIATYFKNDLGYQVVQYGKKDVSKGANNPLDWDVITPNSDPNDASPVLNIQRLKDNLVRQPNKPLLLIIDSHQPHVPWNETAAQNPVAPLPAGNLILPPGSKAFTDKSLTQNHIRAYYQSLQQLAIELRDVRNLIMPMLNHNRMMVFTADQGPEWPFGKYNNYDNGLKVPLIVNWYDRGHRKALTGKTSPQVISETASAVDLLPTLLDAATIIDQPNTQQPNRNLDGKSFAGKMLGNGAAKFQRPGVFGFYIGTNTVTCAAFRSLRNDQFTLIQNLKNKVPFIATWSTANSNSIPHYNYYRTAWIGTPTDRTSKGPRGFWEFYNYNDQGMPDTANRVNIGQGRFIDDPANSMQFGGIYMSMRTALDAQVQSEFVNNDPANPRKDRFKSPELAAGQPNGVCKPVDP